MATTQATKKPQPVDQKTKKIRDADILISVAFIIGCLWTAYESLRMSYEMYSQGLATLYTVPGLFPFIVSLAIIGCSSIVLVKAFRDGGDLKYLHPRRLQESFSDLHAFIAIIVMGLLGIFVFVLIERIPFILAVFLFMAVFMFIFKAAKPVWILVISAVYALVVVYFFSTFVGTRFPIMLLFNR